MSPIYNLRRGLIQGGILECSLWNIGYEEVLSKIMAPNQLALGGV